MDNIWLTLGYNYSVSQSTKSQEQEKKYQNIQVTRRKMTVQAAGKPPEGKFSDYQLTFLMKNTPTRSVLISCSASRFQTIPQNAPLSTSKTKLRGVLYGQLTLTPTNIKAKPSHIYTVKTSDSTLTDLRFFQYFLFLRDMLKHYVLESC